MNEAANTGPTSTDTRDIAVTAYTEERGITEIVHFTTNKGALGVIATGAVLSRARLPQEKYVEHIYTPNCANRLKDAEWTDYVNLSISHVNGQMLGTSQRWHATDDVWWVIFAFEPSLLADPGVHFVTTNNTYTKCLLRGTGVKGLSSLFAPSVEWGWFGHRRYRNASTPEAWTTDPQAEVLYPQQVPLRYLRTIYVHEPEYADTVASWLRMFDGVPQVPVVYQPEVFR